jgi:dienelactone hydrolase
MKATSLAGHPIVAREIAFTSGGFKLKGYLHLPPGPSPFPCMLTNHGSGIDKGTEDISRPGTASLLMSWGIASFLAHRRGYGESEGPPWREEVSADFGTEDYDRQLALRLDRESDDVLAALDIVAALPEIDAAHVGVMGSSFGGTTTLLAASKTDRFRCAVEFAGAAMNWDKTPGLRELMLAAAGRLTSPIFFIQAQNDYSIRPTIELAASLAGTDKSVQSKVYAAFGANNHEGHLLESRGPTIWSEDVRRFLERHL